MMSDKENNKKLLSRAFDIIKSYRGNNYADVTDEIRAEFCQIMAELPKEDKMSLFLELQNAPDSKNLAMVSTKLNEKNGFDLKEHLGALIDRLDFSTAKKNEMKRRCFTENNQPVFTHMHYGYMTQRLYAMSSSYPKDSPEQIEGEKKIRRLINDFMGNNSSTSQLLRDILKKFELNIEISKSDVVNGRADVYNGKIILNITDKAIERIDLLPGLLGHELAHVIDYAARPNKYLGHMAAEENFADLCGQLITEKAGYDSRPWGRYIKEIQEKEEKERGKERFDEKKDMKALGKYRYDTIINSESDETRLGKDFAEKINKNISEYMAVRNRIRADSKYDDPDPEKARLNRALASTRKIFNEIAEKLQFSEQEIGMFPKNKYCLMGIMKQLKEQEENMPMNIIPKNAEILQSNAEFIKFCLKNNELKKYIKITEDIDEEKNLKPGSLFIMTNIDKKENYNEQKAEDLSGDNHANIIIGRSAENGKVLLSAFSEERIGYQPKTFKKGYIIDIPAYLKDYKEKNLLYTRNANSKNFNQI